jgi:hypothetical protein
MVMPCSRSARRPSVSESQFAAVARDPAFLTASSWSSYRLLLSCSSRPISVDLPSSTLPAVVNRSRPEILFRGRPMLEVPLALLQLHRAFLVVVDHAVLALGAAAPVFSSSTISGTFAASDRTAPVQYVQPSDRIRHITVVGRSPGSKGGSMLHRDQLPIPLQNLMRGFAKYSGTTGMFSS